MSCFSRFEIKSLIIKCFSSKIETILFVVKLPFLIQIIFGGQPLIKLISEKSESKVQLHNFHFWQIPK